MPVSNTNTFTAATANGVTTVFPYNFTLLSENDLVVTVAGVVVTTGFTVSGVGDAAGGNVTFAAAPANLARVRLERVMALTRSTDYQYVGSLSSEVLDRDFDRLWLAMQRANQESARGLKLPLGSANSSELPELTASSYLRVNAEGTAAVWVPGPEISGTTQAEMVGFLQAGSGAVPRTAQAKMRDVVSVKDFGATGDGTTDDTTAIQSAINANPGRALYFPSGTYIASALTIPHSMEFIGEGAGSAIKQKSGANAHFISPTADGIKVRFDGLTLDQNNGGQTTGSGKFLFNTTSDGVAGSPHVVEFDHVTFKDFCEGAIRMVGDRATTTREVLKVRDCKFKGGTESESNVYLTFTIFVADAAELVVEGCDFDHGLTLSKQGIPAISVAGTVTTSAEYTEVTIRNNRFRNYGRYTTGSGIGVIDCYVWADKVDISGNKFVGSWTVPIRAKCNARDMVVIGNVLAEFNSPPDLTMNGGISIVSASLSPTTGRYIIADNIVDASVYRGIEVSDSNGTPESIIIANNIIKSPADIAIYVIGCKGFAIAGNIIKSAGGQGIAMASCLGMGRIDNNTIDTTAGTGIQALGEQLTLDVQVHGNIITASTASGISIEDVRYLSLQGNTVKDVVASGSNQRGYRVGGATGTGVGQIKNNVALGTYATAEFSVISAGFTTAIYERGNSWNYRESYLAAAPTTGTWSRGDVAWNTAPAAAGNMGWVCTTAGTPGTWKTFGAISA